MLLRRSLTLHFSFTGPEARPGNVVEIEYVLRRNNGCVPSSGVNSCDS